MWNLIYCGPDPRCPSRTVNRFWRAQVIGNVARIRLGSGGKSGQLLERTHFTHEQALAYVTAKARHRIRSGYVELDFRDQGQTSERLVVDDQAPGPQRTPAPQPQSSPQQPVNEAPTPSTDGSGDLTRLVFAAGRWAGEKEWADSDFVTIDQVDSAAPVGPPLIVTALSRHLTPAAAKAMAALAGAGRTVCVVTDDLPDASVRTWMPQGSLVILSADGSLHCG